jgi:cation transporter-like permease
MASQEPQLLPSAGPSVPPRNQMAVASLVVALISWFCFGLIGSVVAIILGLTARERIAVSGERGVRMATFAVWLSYFHIAISILVLVAVVFFGIRFGPDLLNGGR